MHISSPRLFSLICALHMTQGKAIPPALPCTSSHVTTAHHTTRLGILEGLTGVPSCPLHHHTTRQMGLGILEGLSGDPRVPSRPLHITQLVRWDWKYSKGIRKFLHVHCTAHNTTRQMGLGILEGLSGDLRVPSRPLHTTQLVRWDWEYWKG